MSKMVPDEHSTEAHPTVVLPFQRIWEAWDQSGRAGEMESGQVGLFSPKGKLPISALYHMLVVAAAPAVDSSIDAASVAP